MVTLDSKRDGIQFGRFDNGSDLAKAMIKHVKENLDDLFFVCIGTDRSTGDSLAPLVGTMLREHGYENLIGDINNPVHAENLDERLKEIPEGKTVIAIDASLGKFERVGKYSFNKGSLSPGLGVGKELTKIGDYHICGVVNVSGFMEFYVLQNTRLSLVMKMAKEISSAIQQAFPLQHVNGKANKILYVNV